MNPNDINMLQASIILKQPVYKVLWMIEEGKLLGHIIKGKMHTKRDYLKWWKQNKGHLINQ